MFIAWPRWGDHTRMRVLIFLRRISNVFVFVGSILGVLTVLASSAEAQVEVRTQEPHHRHFGIGVIVGRPNGLSLKGFLTPSTAIDGAIGFGDEFRYIHLHADYLWHFDVQHWDASTLQLYLGLGPEFAFRNHPGPRAGDGRTDVYMGARAPFGFSLMFGGAPFDVFAEMVAGLWFFEDPRAHVDAAMGARFWF
jgi:hypothetical protein